MSETAPELPQVNAEAIDAVFATLTRMEVELDDDPLQFGPKRLQGKVAQTRRMLTECEGLFLRVSHWLQKYRAAHRTLDVELDLEKKDLFANDPEVRAGRNVADREALATMKLREKAQALAKVAQSQADLEAMLIVIKAKRSDLKDVQGRIRDQMKLCNEEIGLGGFWGSKPAPGSQAPDLEASPDVDRKTLRDLHEMFTGTGVEEPDLAAVAPLIDPEPEPEPEPESSTGDTPAESVGDLLADPETEEDPFTVESLGPTGSDEESDEFLSAIGGEDEVALKPRSIESLLDDLDI